MHERAYKVGFMQSIEKKAGVGGLLKGVAMFGASIPVYLGVESLIPKKVPKITTQIVSPKTYSGMLRKKEQGLL
jgi:hypothetical protein